MARETVANLSAANAHLAPNFQPDKALVAQLRGYLNEHSVNFPSNAKKAQLVALFKQHITPRASVILRQRLHVKGSDVGVQRVSSKQLDEPSKKAVSISSSDSASLSEVSPLHLDCIKD